jgi:lipopolysaccharide/colanic/teichoic acid biosynthesis glycosyltransferase
MFGSALKPAICVFGAALLSSLFGRSLPRDAFAALVAVVFLRVDARPLRLSPSLLAAVGLLSAATFFIVGRLLRGGASDAFDAAVPLLFGALVAALVASSRKSSDAERRATPLGPLELRMKRIFDFSTALIAAPLVAALLVALRLANDPVWKDGFFYRQTRTGLRGRLFLLTKIRTMRADAEADGRARWSERAAASVSSFGGRLRRRWIDELPQVFDVLRGDLSLVGPRPERPEFVEGLALRLPKYPRRLLVPPGVTGPAQISGYAGDTSLKKRLRRDLAYARRWTPWSDVRLLFATAVSSTRRKRRDVRGGGEPLIEPERRSSAWKPPSTFTSPRSTSPGS